MWFSPAVSLGGHEIGLWQVLAVVIFPVVFLKVPLNLFILKMACQEIAVIDVAKIAKERIQ